MKNEKDNETMKEKMHDAADKVTALTGTTISGLGKSKRQSS